MIKEDDLVALDGLGQRPLHLAAERGDFDMIWKLLEKAKEKDRTKDVLTAKCDKGQTALHRASWGGSARIVKMMLRYAAEAANTIAAEPDKDGNTALHVAAEKGFKSVVGELVNVSECTAKNDRGLGPLHYAAWSGSIKIVELLLQHSSKNEVKQTSLPPKDVLCSSHDQGNLKMADNHGWLPLHYAAASGQREIVEFLIAHGEDINAASHKDNKIGWTPLHFAVINNHQSVIDLFLEKKAKIVKDQYSWTPLHFAAINGHQSVIDLFLEKKAKIVKDQYSWTPRRFARLKEDAAAPKALPYKGSSISDSVSDEDNKNTTPLFWTSLHRLAVNEQQISPEQLLDKDAEPACEESRGLFLQAAREGLKHLVRILLLWPEMPMLEEDCNEAMLEAAKEGHVTVVNLLLTLEKAIGNVEDKARRTVLSWAAGNGREAVVRLLLTSRKVKNGDVKDKNGWTALLWAAQQGHEAVVKLLLHSEKVKDGDAKDRDGRKALSLAAQEGHEEVVKLLFDSEKIKDGDANNKNGWTAL